MGRFTLDYTVGDAVDAFALTTLNGTKKWFNIYSDVNGAHMSFNKLTSFAGDLESMRITANGAGSTIETFAYSDLAVKAYGGLDLYGGYGPGATKCIRFFPSGNLAAAFSGNGNFSLGDAADNGNKLQVYGTSWFGNNVFFSHPTYATGGNGAGAKWVNDNTFRIYGGPAQESLTFGPTNDITSNSLFVAPYFYATSTGGSNYYVPASGGVYTTPNSSANLDAVVHKFTMQQPIDGELGKPTLVEINKPVNRGTADGRETGLRILFTVTGTARNLRALETVNGDVRLHTNSGRTSIGLDGSSAITSRLDVSGEEGYNQLRLRKKYTPTSSSDTNGQEGDVSWDDNYIYIKTTSGWKRSALASW